MEISKIDKNFAFEPTVKREGLTFFNVLETPEFSIHGVFHDNGKYRRMPEDVAKAVSEGVYHLHTNTAGGRIRFITNSPYVAIRAEVENCGKMSHFPFTASIGLDLYAGKRYVGTFVPPFGIQYCFENVVDHNLEGEQIFTINMPLYTDVKKLYVGLKEGCVLKAAPEYTVTNPIVYYGSSITQGGCASRPGNAYENIVTQLLDCDHINLGFSGSAYAEDVMIDYLASLDMSLFVCDYDHNAPSVDHLVNTHEKLYRAVRKTHPSTPILFLTRPKYHLNNDEVRRLNVVRTTYEKALNEGDKNVYFITGPELMNEQAWESGLVDNTHPNDCGFVSMGYKVSEAVKEILKL